MRMWLLAVGWFSLLGQVVLLRELGVAFFGVELLLVVSLGAWLLSSALGAAVWRIARPRVDHLRLAMVAAAWLIPLSIAATRAARVLLDAVPGALLPLGTQIGLCLTLVLPLGLLAGATFQWVARRPAAPSLTLAYAWESAGALAAGLVATIATLLGVGNLNLALFASAVTLAAAFLGPYRPGWLWPAATITGAALGLAVVLPTDAWLTRLDHPNLAFSRDTAYGRVTVTREAEQIAVFENNAFAYDSQSVAAEELVHLAALAHPAPRQLLLLGGAGENLAGLALAHAPQLIDLVELDLDTVEAVADFLAPVRAALADPRVKRHQADPRAWVARGGQYDLVLVAQNEPLSGQGNRVFTREFFAAAAGSLAPDGILALRLRAADTAWSEPMRARNASIASALAAVFPHTLALPGQSLVLLASTAQLPGSAAPLVQRLADRQLTPQWVSAPYLDYLFTNPRFVSVAAALVTPASLNTDDDPACYRYTMSLWLTQLWPAASRAAGPAALPDWLLGLFWLGAAGALLRLRRSPTGRRLGLAFFAGLIGLVLEGAILLAYQLNRGALYRDLGLLLTAFMTGLTLGAAAAAALRVRTTTGGGPLWMTAGTIGLLVFPCLWLLTFTMTGAPLLLAAASMLSTGAGVASLFAAASHTAAAKESVASTYAADLGGGALGATLGGLVLIPFAGLTGTGAIALGLALLATFLLLPTPRHR